MIYLGADNRGYLLKERIKKYLTARKLAFKDLGAHKIVKNDDFIDYAVPVARAVKGKSLGILVCGSGHGMAIAANKIAGARAILADTSTSAKEGRVADHANILVLAAWHTDASTAEKIVSAFLTAIPSKTARHLRRQRKLKALEK